MAQQSCTRVRLDISRPRARRRALRALLVTIRLWDLHLAQPVLLGASRILLVGDLVACAMLATTQQVVAGL